MNANGTSFKLPGFPERLPYETIFERNLMRSLADGFERFGFQPLDTAAVQPYEVLMAGGAQYSDGGVAKPVFNVVEPEDFATGRRLGLRYDLTVPLARYLAEYGESVDFPLRCYQMNKVWRAERPTKSHWREFYQCDVDVIGRRELSPLYDAEIAVVLAEAFNAMGLGEFTVRISNRVVLAALLASHGIHNDRTRDVVRIVDEAGSRPHKETVAELAVTGMPRAVAEDVGMLLGCRTLDEARILLSKRGADERGLDELAFVMSAALDLGIPASHLCLDFSITRGHDYYTGTVYETFAAGHEDWGAVASGGRYDALLSSITGSQYPGVGMSIGLTRLSALLAHAGKATVASRPAANILVMTDIGGDTRAAVQAARVLRDADLPTQVIFDAASAEHGLRQGRSLGVCLAVHADHAGRLTLRHMRDGVSQNVDLASLVAAVRGSGVL
jgi:histidyl-tRNA synthetase